MNRRIKITVPAKPSTGVIPGIPLGKDCTCIVVDGRKEADLAGNIKSFKIMADGQGPVTCEVMLLVPEVLFDGPAEVSDLLTADLNEALKTLHGDLAARKYVESALRRLEAARIARQLKKW